MPAFESDRLIFLISQPRAGSTMLQRILASHSQVHSTAEPWLMLHPVYALREEGHEAEYGARTAYRALQDFLGTLERGSDHYLEALRRFGLHLYGTASDQAGKGYFLDKTPRYFLIIPELAQTFPQAQFIILLRNPLAVLASILHTWVHGEWLRLSRHYGNLILAPRLLLEGRDLLAERATVVHYESLVQEPALQVAQLCARLNLQFEPAMLDYGRQRTFPGRYGDPAGVEQHTQPTTGSLDRWLELGRSRQGRHLALAYLAELGPERVAGLGYDAAELQRQLEAQPLVEGGLVVSWDRIFTDTPGFANRLSLILGEFMQQRRLAHTGRQLARLLLRRL